MYPGFLFRPKNDVNFMIWIKLDKNVFCMQYDIYLCSTYIAPEKSVVHNMLDFNVFDRMESDILYYNTMGKVFLFGDLNSRIGNKLDYVDNDGPLPECDFLDTDYRIPRVTSDRGTNKYGDLLIDLCKSVNMRIVNGRFGTDKKLGKITCFTHNGESTVDYLITERENFSLLSEIRIYDFNMFSNHASLLFNFKINSICNTQPEEYISFKWKNEHKDDFVSDIARDIEVLCSNLNSSIVSNDDTDVLVDIFTKYLSSRGNIYFEKHIKTHSNNTSKTYRKKNEWFHEDCKNSKSVYIKALQNYNLYRSDENRAILHEKKIIFKKCCRLAKRRYNRKMSDKLVDLKNKKPEEFWKMFKQTKSVNIGCEISVKEFYSHFKNLYSEISIEEDPLCENFMKEFDMNENTCSNSTFENLDTPFTLEEIRLAIKSLNKNKACSFDNIIYEYFIECIDVLDKPLLILFNYILEKQSFPKSWSKGVIIPVHKKGDTSDPNNYRGITLISCFGKLFTTVINSRLKKWAEENNVITDAQFGFKPSYSTIDAIFLLQSLIEKQLRIKGSLYCCFIDLQKCFDSVYRNGMWLKMIEHGINGKLF